MLELVLLDDVGTDDVLGLGVDCGFQSDSLEQDGSVVGEVLHGSVLQVEDVGLAEEGKLFLKLTVLRLVDDRFEHAVGRADQERLGHLCHFKYY